MSDLLDIAIKPTGNVAIDHGSNDIASRINDHNNHDHEPDRFVGMANDVLNGIKSGRLDYVAEDHSLIGNRLPHQAIRLSATDVKIALAKHMTEVRNHAVSLASDPLRLITIYEDNGVDIAGALILTNTPEFGSDYRDGYAFFTSEYLRRYPGLYLKFVNYLSNLPDTPLTFKEDPSTIADVAASMRNATIQSQDHS